MNCAPTSVGAPRSAWKQCSELGEGAIHHSWNAGLGGKLGRKILSPCPVASIGLGAFFFNLLSCHPLSPWKSKPSSGKSDLRSHIASKW